MSSEPQYVPGVCNIGTAEIRKRYLAGWVGLSSTVITLAAFLILSFPSPWRVLLFFPATVTALSFLQATMRFCAAYGLMGVFNVSLNVGQTESVDALEHRQKDRKKAMRIIGYSIFVGIGAAIAGFLV